MKSLLSFYPYNLRVRRGKGGDGFMNPAWIGVRHLAFGKKKNRSAPALVPPLFFRLIGSAHAVASRHPRRSALRAAPAFIVVVTTRRSPRDGRGIFHPSGASAVRVVRAAFLFGGTPDLTVGEDGVRVTRALEGNQRAHRTWVDESSSSFATTCRLRRRRSCSASARRCARC